MLQGRQHCLFDYISNSALSVQAILSVCFHPSSPLSSPRSLSCCYPAFWLHPPLPHPPPQPYLSPPYVTPFFPSILLPPLPCQWQCIALWVVLPDICSFPCTVMPCIERYCNFCIKSFLFVTFFFFVLFLDVVGEAFLYWYCLSFVFLDVFKMFSFFFFLFYESWDF